MAAGQLQLSSLPSLDNLRCFLAAARVPTFRAAARTVALTPAALGQRIRQLEDQLGVRLFERTTRAVSLTGAGLALLPAARAALQAAAACMPAVQGGAPPPLELTIGTRVELGLSFLLPNDGAIASACPGLSLNYYFGSSADLLARVRSQEVDCAVTSARFTDPLLDSLPLHREDYAFVGAARLLQSYPLRRPEQARHHTLLDVDASMPLFRYWRDAAGDRALPWKRVWRVGTASAIQNLVSAGRGVAVLPVYMIRQDLKRGLLRRIFPSVRPTFDHFRLVFRAADFRRARFQELGAVLRRLPLR
jgi:LysR family transcriptional regulator, glycine cleavage system transcriptional activator